MCCACLRCLIQCDLTWWFIINDTQSAWDCQRERERESASSVCSPFCSCLLFSPWSYSTMFWPAPKFVAVESWHNRCGRGLCVPQGRRFARGTETWSLTCDDPTWHLLRIETTSHSLWVRRAIDKSTLKINVVQAPKLESFRMFSEFETSNLLFGVLGPS